MNAAPDIHIRVPGKVMLSGEYAVLFGARSLAMAVDRYMTVGVSPRNDHQFFIDSDLWPQPFALADRMEEPQFRASPLGQALHWLNDQQKHPCVDLRIRSGLKPEDGFGSSSAVTLASLMALYLFCEPELLKALPRSKNLGPFDVLWKLARVSWQLQRQRQPAASGYDFLSQALGAITILQPDETQWPGSYERFQPDNFKSLALKIFRGGRGAPTGPIMSDTLKWLEGHKRIAALISASEAFTDAVTERLLAPDESDGQRFYEACGQFRKIFADSPHYPRKLLDPLTELPGCDQNWSFKTTGAGGEDALLVFGQDEAITVVQRHLEQAGWHECQVNLDRTGISILA